MPHPAMSNGSHFMDRSSSFQTSPDPITGSTSNRSRRYSSTDSLEGSVNSNHSRQGSDSNETGYPTRRLSTSMTRRQSTGGDPLQFIKGKPSTELAQLAETQIKVAAESKKVAITTASLLDEDDPSDWQANLSTWKNRRKSQSERSYQMKEELEKMEREKEGETGVTMATKTYSQIQEERERRKSTSRHFYPIQDEEEDDIFTSSTPDMDKKKDSDETLTMTHKPLAEIAPWARDNAEDDKKVDKDDEEEQETSESDDDDEISNNKENENDISKESNNSFSSPYSKFRSKDSDSKGNQIEKSESFQRTFSSQQQSARPSNTSSQDLVNRSDSFKSVGPRTQSKIGSIMKNFQESQTASTAPKQGYNERIDLKARMRSFESSNNELSSENQNGTRQLTKDKNDNFNNYRNNFEQNDNLLSSASVSHSVRERSKSSSSESKRNDIDGGRSKQVEKTIKIRQKPNDDKGFGFILTGGVDQDKPLTVSKVALGSGADVCELKVNDEIFSINSTDVTDKTSMEVGDMVAKSVSKGYIELGVHRDMSQDDLSDGEEMTSSSDEGEEDLSGRDESSTRQKEQQEPEPMVEVPEVIQPVHVSRVEHQAKIDTFNSQPSKQIQEPADEEDLDEEDGGPPAILRKWQRQRQRNEYAFENSPSLDSQSSPVYKKISLNAPIPQQDYKNDDEDKTESRWRLSKPWDLRQDEWTSQQDEERKPEAQESQNDSSDGQAVFDARQNEMKRQYEESMKLAEQRVEERSRQEQSFLQPEIDKARILEERRLERRNRIQESAAAASMQPPSSSFSSMAAEQPLFSSIALSQQQAPPPPPQPSAHLGQNPESFNSSHVSSLTFNIEGRENNSPSAFSIPRQSANSVIVIDPRNRSNLNNERDPIQPGAPVEFQVKLSSSHLEDPVRMAEEEKERQREREIEEEKMKKIQEKERQLQEQEEMLRQERERLKKEQEEFRQQKLQQQQQLYQKQQQQQQQQQQQSHQQQYHHPPPPQKQEYPSYPYSNPPMVQSSLQPSYANPSSISPVQNTSPASNLSSSSYYSNSVNNQGPSTKPSWPPSQRDPPRSYDPQSFKSANNSTFTTVHPQFNKGSPNVRNTPQDDYGRKDRTNAPKSGKFTREDILAMNKKPFQEPETTRVNYTENQSSLPKQAQNRMTVTREPAIKSQNQAHPMNSAPKARLRNDSEWKDPNKYQGKEPRPNPSREGGARRHAYGSAQDHWLVQEAERRRVSGQTAGPRGPPPNVGPIKPQPDISNRWRDGHENPNPESMPHAIRQTLLQKTAGARGSDGSSHEGDLIPPPQQQNSLRSSPRSVSPRSGNAYNQPPQSYSPSDLSNKYNVNPIHQIQQPPPPTLNRGRPQGSQGHQGPPSAGRENGLPVNGSQLCSHCNQELGFGAAMVIESLGIFFHLHCFRCCVCHASLGTGVQGADVRVRMNKLHCQNCYSNDEGPKYQHPNYRSEKIWIKI